MRDARAEAAARLGEPYDVRVLEPSPPAVVEPPFFADDPLEGGEILPIERVGSRTWADVCGAEVDDGPELWAWCSERWLVAAELDPLPDTFEATRRALHSLAEHVMSPLRHAANTKIGLRYTFRGFGTPFMVGGRQVRVEDGVLVDGDRRHDLGTLRNAGDFVGIEAGTATGVYTPTTTFEADAPLDVDPASARALGDWFGFTARLLEQIRADSQADGGESPSRVQLWPEHFDLAVDLGRDGARANYGGSPGDEGHPEPYLYVGPWGEHPPDPFWNESFGASLSYSQIRAGADPLAFLRQGHDLLLKEVDS